MATKQKKAKIQYGKGKIYKLVNDENNMIHIGVTTQSLCDRFGGHAQNVRLGVKSDLYDAMRAIGSNKFRIILIEDLAASSKNAMDARRYEIAKLVPKENLFNGKHEEKVMANAKVVHCSHRGTLQLDEVSSRYRYRWYTDKGVMNESFSFIAKRTKQLAYMAARDMQNEIYPLTTLDYMGELPFASE